MTEGTNTSVKVNGRVPIPKRNLRQRLLAVAIIAALLLGGLAMARYLLHSKPKAKKRHHKKMQLLVQIEKLRKINTRVVVSGLGSVIPAKETELKPEVSGRITALHPNFHPGGIIKKGEVVAEIDRRDFEIIVTEKEASLKLAQANLELERGQQVVAQRDWQLVIAEHDALRDQDNALALRKPQLAKVEATVSQAQAALDRAKLDLRRTRVLAPFSGVVRHKYVDLGSQVSPQAALITLTGVQTYWLEALIPVRDLHWLGLDKTNTFQAKVKVEAASGNGEKYKGKIINLLPALDKDGLMSRLLIAVRNPLAAGHAVPLIIGTFAQAEITGRPLTGVFKIPRSALWESEFVLIAAPDDSLEIRQPTMVWKDTDWVYVKNGLREGERLVLSQISAPVAGMPLKIAGMTKDKAAKNKKNGSGK
jgi:RND family efflux transporter MFP subunit